MQLVGMRQTAVTLNLVVQSNGKICLCFMKCQMTLAYFIIILAQIYLNCERIFLRVRLMPNFTEDDGIRMGKI